MNPSAQAYRQPDAPAFNPDAPFASVVHLGQILGEHRATRAALWVGYGLAITCGVIAVVVLAASGYSAYETAQISADGDPWETLGPAAIGAGVCVVLAGLFYWLGRRNRKLAAAIFEGGIAHHSGKGLVVAAWDEIDAVYQRIVRQYVNGVYTGTYYTYTVHLRDGRKLVLDQRLHQIETLGTMLVERSARALLPRYDTALRAGQRIDFGPIGLDQKGLYSGSKFLGWNEIKAVRLAQGTLSVSKEGKWLNWTSAQVPAIPNFLVLMSVLTRFTAVE